MGKHRPRVSDVSDACYKDNVEKLCQVLWLGYFDSLEKSGKQTNNTFIPLLLLLENQNKHTKIIIKHTSGSRQEVFLLPEYFFLFFEP